MVALSFYILFIRLTFIIHPFQFHSNWNETPCHCTGVIWDNILLGVRFGFYVREIIYVSAHESTFLSIYLSIEFRLIFLCDLNLMSPSLYLLNQLGVMFLLHGISYFMLNVFTRMQCIWRYHEIIMLLYPFRKSLDSEWDLWPSILKACYGWQHVSHLRKRW